MNVFHPWIYLSVGVVLFAIGWLHRWPAVAQADQRAFLSLHKVLRKALPLFRALWPLGTLAGIVAEAALVALLASWEEGLLVLLSYGVVVQGEILIKRRLARRRPFEALPDVPMAQPKQPRDASFPSGDALRVWLAALTLAPLLPAPWGWAVLGLAVLVSLGRIALGVHYPLDVIAGTGLGFVAAVLAWGLAGMF